MGGGTLPNDILQQSNNTVCKLYAISAKKQNKMVVAVEDSEICTLNENHNILSFVHYFDPEFAYTVFK